MNIFIYTTAAKFSYSLNKIASCEKDQEVSEKLTAFHMFLARNILFAMWKNANTLLIVFDFACTFIWIQVVIIAQFCSAMKLST